MKASYKLAPALVVMALVAAVTFAIGSLSQSTSVFAEGSAGHEQPAAQINTANVNAESCESREVAVDEGYGVSRREIRRICH